MQTVTVRLWCAGGATQRTETETNISLDWGTLWKIWKVICSAKQRDTAVANLSDQRWAACALCSVVRCKEIHLDLWVVNIVRVCVLWHAWTLTVNSSVFCLSLVSVISCTDICEAVFPCVRLWGSIVWTYQWLLCVSWSGPSGWHTPSSTPGKVCVLRRKRKLGGGGFLSFRWCYRIDNSPLCFKHSTRPNSNSKSATNRSTV